MDDTLIVSVGDMLDVHALKVRSDSGMYLDFCEPVCWFSAKSILLVSLPYVNMWKWNSI